MTRTVTQPRAGDSDVVLWCLVLVAALASAAFASLSPAMSLAIAAAAGFVALARFNIASAAIAWVVLAPWATLGNTLVGSRFVALSIDAALTISCAIVLAASHRRQITSDFAVIAAISSLLLLLGAGEMLNPRGVGFVGALEGFRVFFLPLIAMPLGYLLSTHSTRFSADLTGAIAVSAALIALMGIRQTVYPTAIDNAIIANSQSGLLPFQITGTDRLRAFSPMPGPFHYGFLMSVGIVVIAGSLVHRASLGLAISLCVCAVGLLLNATRLNWLGVASGLATLLFVSLDRRHLRRWLMVLGGAAGAALIASWLVLSVEAFSPVRQLAAELLVNPTANSSYVYRILDWQYEVIPAIKSAPLLGYGTGAAKDGIGLFRSHNILLKLLLEGGAIEFVMYSVLIGAVLVALVRRRHAPLARTSLALIIGTHAAGMFGPLLDAYPISAFYWLVVGSALAMPVSRPGRADLYGIVA